MARKKKLKSITVALMLDYCQIPEDQLYYLAHNDEARRLFGFLSTCMIHHAEQNSKTWAPMIESMQSNRRIERAQRNQG